MLKRSKKIGFSIILLCLLIVFFIFLYSCKRSPQPVKPSSEEIYGAHAEHVQEPERKQLEKKTLYRCPRHPNYVSDKPGDCPICGMTLVPVEEEQKMEEMEMPQGTVQISPEKQQLIGVTFAKAEFRTIIKTVRTVARLTYDETRLKDINTKFPGWIENLYADFRGQLVNKGQPLFSIYSPELVAAQEEYLLALKAVSYFGSRADSEEAKSSASLLNAARRRLVNWDITEEQIQRLKKSGTPLKGMAFHAPFSGFVIEKNILQGKFVNPGEKLYTLADISRIWALADIYEYELPFISPGQKVQLELPYLPEENFEGRIAYVYPYLENATRTVKVRIELPNKNFKLKPEMYGAALIHRNLGEKLTVPRSAVLDSGTRTIVFIDRGEGYFEPREVRLGVKTDDYFEVLEGIHAGERVVTSANFLIDSESKLKSAIRKPHEHEH